AALALPDRDQRLVVVGPVDVVDPEAELHLVAADLLVAARQADERLAAPGGHIDRLAILRQLDAVRAGCFAAGHLLPLTVRMPLPELAVLFAVAHLRARVRIRASREKIRRDESAVLEATHRVEADRLWRNHAPDPSDLRHVAAYVDVEHLDRFAVAVADREQTLDRPADVVQPEAVSRELLRIRRARAVLVEPIVASVFRGCGRIHFGHAAVARADRCEAATTRHRRGDHP